MRTYTIPSCYRKSKISIMPPDLALCLALISSNYLCLEHISFIVPNVFEPLKLYCIGRDTSEHTMQTQMRPGTEIIKLFSCSTQLSMKFFLLINVKMPTIVGILTFMSRKNNIVGLSESEKS